MYVTLPFSFANSCPLRNSRHYANENKKKSMKNKKCASISTHIHLFLNENLGLYTQSLVTIFDLMCHEIL
jgi:hypothetical protein